MDSRLGRSGTSTLCFLAIVPIISIGAAFPAYATAASMFGNFAAEGAFSVVYVQAQVTYASATAPSNTPLGVPLY